MWARQACLLGCPGASSCVGTVATLLLWLVVLGRLGGSQSLDPGWTGLRRQAATTPSEACCHFWGLLAPRDSFHTYLLLPACSSRSPRRRKSVS